MQLVRTIPAAWRMPELRTFKCAQCGVLRTEEFVPAPGRKDPRHRIARKK
jgi:hypothetical protein